MKIFADGTIAIDTKAELELVKNYVESNGLDKFNLKIGLEDTASRIDISKDVYIRNFYDNYADLLAKVDCLDLSYSNDIYIINYCPNLTNLTLPNIYPELYKQYEDVFTYFKKMKTLGVSNLALLKSRIFVNASEINIRFHDYMPYYMTSDKNKLDYITDGDLYYCTNLEKLNLMLLPNFYSIKLDGVNFDSLSLVGNFNLSEISLPKSLGNLKELRVYSNNDRCNFKAEEIVDIIRANFNGENNLQKFVFDIYGYPKVIKLLEKDLKNPKFKTIFNNLVYLGEFIEGKSVYEIDAGKMEIYDNIINNIIKTCGVQKTDNDLVAFSKLYLFMACTFKYNNKVVENGSRSKLSAMAVNYACLKNQYQYLKMIGGGFNVLSTFGFLQNNFQPVCCGFSRALRYMLGKVGIYSELEYVLSASEEEMKQVAELPIEYKYTNHMLLRVKLADGYLYADPTADSVYIDGGASNLSLLSDKIFKDNYIFSESEFYRPKEKEISQTAEDELLFALNDSFNNINKSENVIEEYNYKTANDLTNWLMPNDYKAFNNYIRIEDDKKYIDEYLQGQKSVKNIKMNNAQSLNANRSSFEM